MKTNLKFITASLFVALTLASPQFAQDWVSSFNNKRVDVKSQLGIIFDSWENITPTKLVPDLACAHVVSYKEVNVICDPIDHNFKKSYPGILIIPSRDNQYSAKAYRRSDNELLEDIHRELFDSHYSRQFEMDVRQYIPRQLLYLLENYH